MLTANWDASEFRHLHDPTERVTTTESFGLLPDLMIDPDLWVRTVCTYTFSENNVTAVTPSVIDKI
jgi:hypothetical protein